MASSLFQQKPNQTDLLRMIQNPQEAFNNLMRTNPEFRKFYEENKNKTPEQIAQEHGIDLNNALQHILFKN